MVPPPHPADSESAEDRPLADWRRRIATILQISSTGIIVELYGAHGAAAKPLIETLLDGHAPDDADAPSVHVCFGAGELLDVPPGSRVVLLDYGDDAAWLNLHRPIVRDHQLTLALWRPEDHAERMQTEAKDFLDWVSHRVEIPKFPPAFAVCRAERLLEASRWLAIRGAEDDGLVDALGAFQDLAPDAAYDDIVEAMRAGAVVVRGLAGPHDPWRFLVADAEAGWTHRVILADPELVPPLVPSMDATPQAWPIAAERLRQAGVLRPRIAAALNDLQPAVERNGIVLQPSDEQLGLLREVAQRGATATAVTRAGHVGSYDVAASLAFRGRNSPDFDTDKIAKLTTIVVRLRVSIVGARSLTLHDAASVESGRRAALAINAAIEHGPTADIVDALGLASLQTLSTFLRDAGDLDTASAMMAAVLDVERDATGSALELAAEIDFARRALGAARKRYLEALAIPETVGSVFRLASLTACAATCRQLLGDERASMQEFARSEALALASDEDRRNRYRAKAFDTVGDGYALAGKLENAVRCWWRAAAEDVDPHRLLRTEIASNVEHRLSRTLGVEPHPVVRAAIARRLAVVRVVLTDGDTSEWVDPHLHRYSARELDRAADELRSATNLQPQRADWRDELAYTHFLRAQILDRLGDDAEAKRERASALDVWTALDAEGKLAPYWKPVVDEFRL